MDNYIECRVFKMSVGWGDVIFYFPVGIIFKEIKTIPNCIPLLMSDYVNKIKFDKEFLSIIDSETINNKVYYFTYYVPRNLV